MGDLPAGYECTLYAGRMVGKLGAYGNTKSLQKFNFEMYDADDSTAMVLRDVTYEASAEELARWDNAGDTVGIVIASRGNRMEMVLAYNLTRRKWFCTGYYPHAKDLGLASKMSVPDLESFSRFSFYSVFLCGLGLVLLPVAYILGSSKTAQCKVINPPGYRTETARKIADAIQANERLFVQRTGPAADPSL